MTTFSSSCRSLLLSGAALLMPLLGLAQDPVGQEIYFFEASLPGEPPPAMPAPDKAVSTDRPSGPEAPTLQGSRDIARLEARIRQLEASAGPYDSQLEESLLDLALQLQDQGLHEEAIEQFARAEHVSRVNHGLESLQQATSVRGMIDSLMASQRYGEARERQQYLINLYRRSDEEVAMDMVPLLEELADWGMAQFQQGIYSPVPPSISISFNGGRSASPAMAARFGAFFSLAQAQQAYVEAVRTLLKNKAYSHPQLMTLEQGLVETYFLMAYRRQILEDPENYLHSRVRYTGTMIGRGRSPHLREEFSYGKSAYQRMLAYQLRNPAGSLEDYVETLLALGDWHVLFSRHMSSQEYYRRAHEALQSAALSDAVIDDFLKPEIPVPIPVFLPAPMSLEKARQEGLENPRWRGWFEVSFQLSRHGKVRSLEELDSSPGASDEARRQLLRGLRHAQFRPQFEGDDALKHHKITLRYHYGY